MPDGKFGKRSSARGFSVVAPAARHHGRGHTTGTTKTTATTKSTATATAATKTS